VEGKHLNCCRLA
jgi:hypothetical protein